MLSVPVLALDGHTTTKTPLVGTPAEPDKWEQSLSRKFALQEGARRLAGSKSLDGCFRRRQFGADAIEAVYYPARDTAGVRHIQTCGSRWACPVCASLLSELSRRELQAAILEHELAGGGIVMATFTIPHYQDQSCAKVLGSQSKKKGGEDNPLYGGLKCALGLFSAGRAGQALYQEIGIVGTVRNLEVTLGDNGWHCHSHAIWFVDHPLTPAQLKRFHKAARLRWISCIMKAGLPCKDMNALRKHSFRLTTDQQYIQDYVVKMGKETDWHIEQELSKNNTKLGKHGGRTPMQLLADYTFEGDDLAGEKWAEYAATYRGSKQLYWSKGLRGRLLGSEREYTDDELLGIAETGELPEWARPPESVLIESPTDREWSKICADGVRGMFISLVRQVGKTGDRTAFEEWYQPYRVFERNTPLTSGVERVKFDLIEHERFGDERDEIPAETKCLADTFGRYVNPLLLDQEAAEFWPGLTPDRADRILAIQAEKDAVGESLPFFAARQEKKEALVDSLSTWVSLPAWLLRAVHEFSAYPMSLDVCLSESERDLLCAWKQQFKPSVSVGSKELSGGLLFEDV